MVTTGGDIFHRNAKSKIIRNLRTPKYSRANVVKQKNISPEKRVILAVAEQNNPYDMVTIWGKVVDQITGREAEAHIDKLVNRERRIPPQSS